MNEPKITIVHDDLSQKVWEAYQTIRETIKDIWIRYGKESGKESEESRIEQESYEKRRQEYFRTRLDKTNTSIDNSWLLK